MEFVTRAEWGAAAPLANLTPWPAGQPTGYTLHWEGAGGVADHAHCAAEVRSIQAFHQHSGYIDIAYNWIICLHGVIFEGRPAASFESAAQRGGNPTHISICFMWGASWHLTDLARHACVTLIQAHRLNAMLGHRDEPSCQTSCPGDENETFVHQLPALVAAGLTPPPAPRTPVPAPLPPAGLHHPVLRMGNVGPAVRELQRKLNGGAGQHLQVDGVFGAHTEASVLTVQRFFHLQVDGIAGPKTWSIVDYGAALKGVA